MVPLGIEFALKGESFQNIIQETLQKYTGELNAIRLGTKFSFVLVFGHLLLRLKLEYQHEKIIIKMVFKLDPHTNMIKELMKNVQSIPGLEFTKINDHKKL
jgi:hypothetical protein